MGTHTGRGSLSSVNMLTSLHSESYGLEQAKTEGEEGKSEGPRILRGDDPLISARSLRGRFSRSFTRQRTVTDTMKMPAGPSDVASRAESHLSEEKIAPSVLPSS